jgi:LCP family protein required for cell wall assembly
VKPLITSDIAPRRAAWVDPSIIAKPQPIKTAIARQVTNEAEDQTIEIDMLLPGASELFIHRPILRIKRRLTQMWQVRTATACAVLLLAVGAWLGVLAYINLHQAFGGDGTTAVSLEKKVNPNLLKGEGDGRVNVLLLGNGGQGHEAPDLTDTIMLASIDPVNHKVALVSVPRDLWINLPGHGNMKINAAYETGKFDYLGRIDSSNKNSKAVEAGFATADQAVEQVLGVTIHYNALVNFISFRQAVNAIGGVTVNVPETLYDPTMAWENHWNSVLAKKGIQQFTGQQALVYARSRETSSDFARAERQRALITAIKDKVVTLGTLSNPIKISKLFGTLGNNVKTDLSIGNASRVYDLTKSIPDGQIKSLGLGDKNTLVTTARVGNQSVVMPTAGEDNYGAIQLYIRQQLPDGYIIKEGAKVAVLNGSNQLTMGANETTELKSYGYNVVKTGAYNPGQAKTQLIDLSGGKDPYTKHYLERRFSVKATKQLPSTVQSGGADFIIILGNNETTR